jgi:hypothetical protein
MLSPEQMLTPRSDLCSVGGGTGIFLPVAEADVWVCPLQDQALQQMHHCVPNPNHIGPTILRCHPSPDAGLCRAGPF